MDGGLAMDDVMTTVISLQTPTPVPTLQWKARPLLTFLQHQGVAAFKCNIKPMKAMLTSLHAAHCHMLHSTALLYS